MSAHYFSITPPNCRRNKSIKHTATADSIFDQVQTRCNNQNHPRFHPGWYLHHHHLHRHQPRLHHHHHHHWHQRGSQHHLAWVHHVPRTVSPAVIPCVAVRRRLRASPVLPSVHPAHWPANTITRVQSLPENTSYCHLSQASKNSVWSGTAWKVLESARCTNFHSTSSLTRNIRTLIKIHQSLQNCKSVTEWLQTN